MISPQFSVPVFARNGVIALFLGLFIVPLSPLIFGQEAVTEPTEASSTEIAESNIDANGNPRADSTPATQEVSSEPRRFAYHWSFSMRGVYDDNINLNQTGKIGDFYFAFEPAVIVGFGDLSGEQTNSVRLTYAPSAVVFLDHSENDGVQHLINLAGQHRFERVTLSLDESIAILDGTDIRTLQNTNTPGSNVNLDVGGRNRYETYTTHLTGSYDLTGKTFLSGGLDSLITNYESAGLISSAVLSGNLFINYKYSEKVVIGLGGSGGYDWVDDPEPNQTFEQVNARVSYQATGKISLNASGGFEFRQFEDSSRGQYEAPVFELSATYQPFDGTNFILSGNRRTYNSGTLSGQDFAGTTINATLRQRLLQRYFLTFAGGYQNLDYFSTTEGVNASRNDDYYFLQILLDFNVTRYWTVGGYYLHRENDSSTPSYQFSDNQSGFRTGINF